MAAMQHTELHLTPARLLLRELKEFVAVEGKDRLDSELEGLSRQAFQFTVQTVFTFYSYVSRTPVVLPWPNIHKLQYMVTSVEKKNFAITQSISQYPVSYPF